ncbi:hypothetical protein [Jiangella alkaliphila]|uniref:hypothetical protein n=1 Tax=Jiangella alkaliphila TaxID=419479 RepID=UPI000699B13C|nr:hypothetical protein [Jiangella alkaliphila]
MPRRFWRSSLARALPPVQWADCRAWAFDQADERCTVCGSVTGLQCDEVWSFEEWVEGPMRVLTGLRALCYPCHAVKHFGRTLHRGDADAAVKHLMRVNGWSRREVHVHISAAFAVFDQRNQVSWAGTDLTWLRDTLGIDATLS